MEELKILQKTYDMMHYLYDTIHQYPKSEKFSLGTDTKHAAHELLRMLITANKRYHKKTTMQDADIQLDILRHFVRLGKDLGFMSLKRYEVLSGMTTEIGKMLGGWMRNF